MSYYYCEYCKDYKKKNHDCYKKSSKCYDKYDGYYEKCDKKHEEKPCINVKVDCCKCEKGGNSRESAFRAVSEMEVNMTVLKPVKVLFENEQFDLADEYNPATSTFIPKTRGVYSIIGAITFLPSILEPYSASLEVIVNGNPSVFADNDYYANFDNYPIPSVISVSGILQLEAGDTVEMKATVTTDGLLRANRDGAFTSSFEAARFPSPAE